mmetsp:Transcript_60779/g.95817  ORF Transcript_60779/g.95817 Transcript_60779/m.95817 type:complete len:219 (+) Transcript_60779:754-1410(+)
MSSFSKHLSHSSSTNCVNLSSFKSLSRQSARTRPGVPIKTCGQLLFNISLSSVIGTPPYTTAVLTSAKNFANRSNSCLIWYASSRAWQITSTLTAFSEASTCCKHASTNTAVLPIPDFAWHKISVPRIAWGMHACCTSEGCSNPQSTVARSNSGFNKKSLKPDAWIAAKLPFFGSPSLSVCSSFVSFWFSSSSKSGKSSAASVAFSSSGILQIEILQT